MSIYRTVYFLCVRGASLTDLNDEMEMVSEIVERIGKNNMELYLENDQLEQASNHNLLRKYCKEIELGINQIYIQDFLRAVKLSNRIVSAIITHRSYAEVSDIARRLKHMEGRVEVRQRIN
ncbi:MAG: hypothetical protein AABX96_01975 [Nanoarchaeota archaeon]